MIPGVADTSMLSYILSLVERAIGLSSDKYAPLTKCELDLRQMIMYANGTCSSLCIGSLASYADGYKFMHILMVCTVSAHEFTPCQIGRLIFYNRNYMHLF